MPLELQAIAYALGLVLAVLAAAILTHPKTRGFLMRLLIVAAAAVSALAIAGCASQVGELKPPATAGVAPQERLELLKEANRHLETCDRTYAWPFAVTVVCKAKQDASDLAAQVGAAVKAALAEARAGGQ